MYILYHICIYLIHIYAHNIYILYTYMCLHICISMYIVCIYVPILYNAVTI